ncbi:5'-3' exoribonuclease 2 isoform X1 [Bactrocera tryoni]|uniref:5'-3' exoribonuclease 2 isoform X1 n=1 Tax=Bactrocera tryoni TaxID=59916 RepID=UPI001A992F5D|nr:5'-3' exoribonuclease 2 isoform X1 [Bactrocera tryoni]
MSALLSYLLCASAVILTLAAPQYVDPYATSNPQFAQLSTTPYTGYGTNIRIWPWVIGQYTYPSNQYYSNSWNTNTNPSSFPYGYNPYNPANTYNPYSNYNPYGNTNNYNPYNPYNRNTGTNTYWNGFAWVNSFRSASKLRK